MKGYPSSQRAPIKCLGKWYDNTIKDKQKITAFQKWVKEMVRKIFKTSQPGKFKAWISQNSLLPRMLWPLMLYEIGQAAFEATERILNSHLRRWLGVPPCFSSHYMYSCTAKLRVYR